MEFFFYGTLLDKDVQSLVIGRRLRPGQFESAHAPGYRRVFLNGAWYPALVPASGAWCPGIIVRGLGRREIDLIDHFEDEDYEPQDIEVVSRRRGRVAARAYLPVDTSRAADTPWDLATWRRRFKWQFVARTTRFMRNELLQDDW